MVPQMRNKMNTTGININFSSAFLATSTDFRVRKWLPGTNPQFSYKDGKQNKTKRNNKKKCLYCSTPTAQPSFL